MRIRPFKLLQFFHGALHLSSQLPVRVCMLLLAFLMTLAGFFGIDAILGAFSAEFDVGAIARSLTSMLLIPMFLILLLIVWGVPVMLYRKDLTKEERLPFALYLATALPLVVAITDIGVHTGSMREKIAASLIAAAATISSLLFPACAEFLLARGRMQPLPIIETVEDLS